MARNKNFNWILPEGTPTGTGKTHSWESIHAAILMDIRDELQNLNSILHCRNFLEIPHKMDQIVRNTTKKPKLKAVPKRQRAA
jgi:hypothetical protein